VRAADRIAGSSSAIACALIAFVSPALGAATSPTHSVLRATLDNGLRVAIVRDPIGPVVTTEMNYLVGSDESPPDMPGLAHAQEHMLFRGGAGLSGDQLAAISAELGGDANADTRETVTQYHFTVPADDLDVALRVEASRMRSVDDDEAAWERERGAIEQEIAQDDSNPANVFFRALHATAFKGTPYAQDGLGTRESFERLTASTLRNFYRAWYGPNNAVLVIAGDVDPPKALERVKALFASIPRRPAPAQPAVDLQPLHHAKVPLRSRFPFKVSFISYRLPGYESPDFVAGQILADVLQSKRGALASLVVNGRALDVEFSQSPPLPKSGLGTVVAIAPPDRDDSAMVDAVRRILDDYAANGVPADLVDAAKRREFVQAAEDRASIPLVAQAWSEALAVEGANSPDDDLEAVKNITSADVNRVAKQYLAPDLAIDAVAVPPDQQTNQPSGAAAESVLPSDANAVTLPDWAASKLTALSAPPAGTSALTRVLSNGIRVVAQPEPGDASVEIVGDVKTAPAVEAPPGQEGVAEIENDLFDYGTTTLDREQFQAALDEIGADETSGTRFSIKLLAPDLDRGMQLLADAELHPQFPASAFPVVRQKNIGIALGRSNSAQYQLERALDRALYPLYDPALRETTPRTLSSLTLDNVKAYYAKTFRPDLTTIVVIGNVAPEQAFAEVEKWFGDWSAAGQIPAVELPSVPTNDPASSVLSPPGDSQDLVSMAETLNLVRANDDYYALRLGNELLGGATLASKLYKDLRENLGLVYFVGSDLEVGKTRSTFSLRFGCDPSNVARARQILHADVVAMQNTPVTQDALQRAKALLVRRIPLSQSSADEIASGLLDLSESGLPLDEPSISAGKYIALQASDVTRAFARWIRADGFAQVVVGPYPR
jgi:zinc protease